MRTLSKRDKEVIRALTEFKKQIVNIQDDDEGHAWVNKIYSCLQKWIGKEAALSVTFASMTFSAWETSELRAKNDRKYEFILDNIIEYVKETGVLKEINWIYTADKKLLTTIS